MSFFNFLKGHGSPLHPCVSQPGLCSKIRLFWNKTWSVRLISAPDLTEGVLVTSPCVDSDLPRETFSIIQNQRECWLGLQRAHTVPGRELLPPPAVNPSAPACCWVPAQASGSRPAPWYCSHPFLKAGRIQLAAELSGGSPGLTCFANSIQKQVSSPTPHKSKNKESSSPLSKILSPHTALPNSSESLD